ncbi:MAG: DUF4082 domain-containing protein [Stigonema ocellatum SAG 48.90 = DSM 106950]|nr:DUF4082 domain-containing protein [Stigonema ocellatum SAG 48.90 = DSM 106950]
MNRKLQLPLRGMRVNLLFIAALISCMLTVGFGLSGNVGITNAQTVRTTYGNNSLPWPIPGMIEAENFDEGTPSDPAYANVTPGLAPADQFYRDTEVNIGVDNILGLADIAYINPGEWLEYTVNVAETGTYDIGVHIATPLDGTTLHIEFSGVDKTGTINVPNTGCYGSDLHGWQCFQDVTVSGVSLTGGVQRMRVVFESTAYTVDYYNIMRQPGTTPNQSLFTTSSTPFKSNNSDNRTLELGMKFQSDVDGQITAVRYWKGSWETDTHTGTIWSADGTLLATVPFTNETATGWQEAQLSTPLTITANTTYVVSVNANQCFASTIGGLESPLSNQNLRSVADDNNGVFGNIGTFPTNSFQNTNYFRDIQFVAF